MIDRSDDPEIAKFNVGNLAYWDRNIYEYDPIRILILKDNGLNKHFFHMKVKDRDVVGYKQTYFLERTYDVLWKHHIVPNVPEKHLSHELTIGRILLQER